MISVPPEVPQVTFKQAGRTKIVFQITEVPSFSSPDNPPVTEFEIRSINFNNLKDLDEPERKKQLAESRPNVMNKSKELSHLLFWKLLMRLSFSAESNTYDVEHLNPNTLYTFEIRAVNEAGQSDPFIYNATTLEPNAPEPMIGSASSAPSILPIWWCVLASIVFRLSSWQVWRHWRTSTE